MAASVVSAGIASTIVGRFGSPLRFASSCHSLAEVLADAQALAAQIEKESITLSIKMGENGRPFGSISSKEIAEAIKSQLGHDIDKKKIVMKDAIKAPGTRTVGIKLHTKVTAELTVKIEEA